MGGTSLSMIWNFGTPINPVFLTLPYLTKAAKLGALDEMLEDLEFPLAEEIFVVALGERLEVVALGNAGGVGDRCDWWCQLQHL